MKKFIVTSLVVITLAIFTYKIKTKNNQVEKPLELPNKQMTLDEALNLINEKDCLENISYLCSDELEGRMSGKKGNVLAMEYLKKELESYGLKTITQKFKINKVNPGPKQEIGEDYTENLYAWVDGSELKDEIVVVGAHFDHIGYGPRYSRSQKQEVHNGADDNASGTVAVLEVAKAMAKLKPARTVLFQFYSAEEMGLLGSRYYCDFPLFPKEKPDIKNHVAMINLDMVGHLKFDQYQVSVPEGLDIPFQVNKLSEKYKFAKKIIANGGGSDHASFNNKRVPNIFLHTGLHQHYHTPSDDVETLNLKGIVEISKYAFELCWNLANYQKLNFDESKFKEMPYTHDHGQEKF